MRNIFPYAVITAATAITFALSDGHSPNAVTRLNSAIGNTTDPATSDAAVQAARKHIQTCRLTCAPALPSVEASRTTPANGVLSVIDHEDGTRQWALDGKPLYFGTDDTDDHAVTDGIGGV